MSEEQEALFEDRPAPWTVETFRLGGAAVIAANGATVLTTTGVALAEFIADAANTFASDEYVFIASDNNAQKIAVLALQRDEARGELAEFTAIADAQAFRLFALHESLRDMAQSWLALVDGLERDAQTPYCNGKVETLRDCARELARTFDAVMSGSTPAKEE